MTKKPYFFCVLLAVFLIIAASPVIAASLATVAEQIEQAFMNKEPYPLPSQEISDLTVDMAYEIQSELVTVRQNKGEEVMGYKAGFTSTGAQEKFGVPGPARGTLFKSMFRWPGTLYRKNFAKMFIETEIGYRFGEGITEPVEDKAVLKKAVAIVFPAIELPDIYYSDMKLVKGADLIAANILVRKVLVGTAKAVTAKDLNAVSVKLFHNGEEITSGVGMNALGDQWEALKWTVNDVIARGGKINAGDVIITGAISKLLPAKVGRYVADYGEFGTIEFEYK